MKHIKDETFRGHEIIIYQDGNEFTCDIRSDDFDGDIIAGYSEFKTLEDARYNAMTFIDGYKMGSK